MGYIFIFFQQGGGGEYPLFGAEWQGHSQEMIKRSPNLLIVESGQGLGYSHKATWWNLAIFFYVQAENRLSKRQLDGSLTKSLLSGGGPDLSPCRNTAYYCKYNLYTSTRGGLNLKKYVTTGSGTMQFGDT